MTERIVQGNQKNWNDVRKQTDQPIITIITSTFNAVKDLPWTIDSLKYQTYPYVQWIVVDGSSTDGTIKLLEENNDVIDTWFSEPDTGIYNAWNKALEYVQGDWVLFIGAGDEIYSSDTLEEASEYLRKANLEYDFVYGKVQVISENCRTDLFIEGESWDKYQNRYSNNQLKVPPHPSLFHHFTLFKEARFQDKFKIIADSYFVIQNLDKKFMHLPLIIDKMPRGGVSNTPEGVLKCFSEFQIANDELNIKLPLSATVKARMRYLFTKYALKVMSEKQYGLLIDFTKVLRGKPKIYTVE